MKESSTWLTVQKALMKSQRDDVTRVENTVGMGTPDVHYCISDKIVYGPLGVDSWKTTEGWLELKQIADYPKRPTTPVRVDHFTPQQRVWLTRRSLAGGRCHVLIQIAKDYHLFEGRVAAQWLGSTPRDRLLALVEASWFGSLDHAGLREELRCS